jgi:hypothetical protein
MYKILSWITFAFSQGHFLGEGKAEIEDLIFIFFPFKIPLHIH